MMSEPLALIPGDAELVVELDESQIRELHTLSSDAIAAAETAIAALKRVSGPNPAPLPAHLAVVMNMGAGHFRHVNATIERLFRARNAARGA